MEMRVVCLVSVWTCAFLTTLVMASPSQARGPSDDVEMMDDAMSLHTYFGLAPPSLDLTEAFADEEDEDDEEDDNQEDDLDTFSRHRRLLSGVHSRHSGSGRRFRSRPRVYIPRRRHTSRGKVSPY